MRHRNDILKTITITMGSISLSMAITYALCMTWGENHLIEIKYSLSIGFIAPLIITPVVCAVFVSLNNKLKETEQLLKDENHWRGLLFEESRDAIVVLDRNAKVLEANTRFADMLGYSKEEIHQLHVWDWDAHFRKEEILGLADDVDYSGHYFESRHRCKDGRIIDVELSNSGTTYGEQKLILCICRDITDRKKVEQEREDLVRKLQGSLSEIKTLRGSLESVDHLKMTLDAAELGVFDFTVDLKQAESRMWSYAIPEDKLFLNDRCLELAGFVPEDSGRAPGEMVAIWARKVHPEDFANISPVLQAITSAKSDKMEFMYRIQTEGRGWRWLLARGVIAERDPGSKSIRVVGVLTDVDSMVTADREKRRAQQRFDRIVEDSHLGIFTAEDGIIRYVNDSVERISGYARAELIGKNFIDLVDDADKKMVMNRHLNRLKGYNVSSCYTVRIRNKAGNLRWFEVDSMPFEWEERPSILVFIRDVTLEKALEKRELHSEKIQAIGTLAGGIAHDFNNILSSIMGFTEICMMKAPADSFISNRLGHVMAAAKRARDLVKQILAFSRQDEAALNPVDVALVAKEVLKFIGASTSGTITIRSDIGSNLGTIMADPTRLHQVIMNLCTNAVYAMQDGGGILTVTLSECVLDDSDHAAITKGLTSGKYLRLSVSDTGHGMSPETIKDIFNPYFTTKPIGEGTGLGLSVTYGIVSGFNGAINVYSEEGKGSVFHVYLPKYAETGEAFALECRPVAGGNETILLVDDEEMQLEMSRERLEDIGYTVVPRSNGIEAFQAFIDNPDRFDLVFSDYAMPGMTGLELTKRIREVDAATPIILCSGFSRDVPPQLVADYAIGAVLNKPLLIHEITETIRRLLD